VPRTNHRRIAIHDLTATEWFPSDPPSIERQNIRSFEGCGWRHWRPRRAPAFGTARQPHALGSLIGT